ncbi:hypothetical protein ACPCAB_15540 [Streptomyces koyangensis]|uniref:hypothetical protein n=1 Tax=Streptomyces koyangensis TaxID=188770 RepID=UPI003C2AC228
MGSAEFGGDAVAGDKHVHQWAATSPPLRVVGPVRKSELDEVVDTFTGTRRYDELRAHLASDGVLVLRGRPGTGRRTAALRMLVQEGPEDGEVRALDPGTEPADFADHVTPGQAHLVVDPVIAESGAPGGPLRDVHLNAVRQRLGPKGLFVVVVGLGTTVEDAEVHDWAPPGPIDVVRAHLTSTLRRMGDSLRGTTLTAEVQRLLELSASVQYLSSNPSPRESAGFARLLVEHAAGRRGEEALLSYGHESLERIVGGLFGSGSPPPGQEPLRDRAFLIALAVFDGSPFPLVAELGDRLHQLLSTVEEPSAQPGQAVFGSSPAERLAWARAGEYDDEIESAWGRLPERVVAFHNGSQWSVVLRHVWTHHPAVRMPMCAWLRALSRDRRTVVRLRAAVAAGVLVAADFTYGFDAFLRPWGGSAVAMERQLAAWSLYTAAEHGRESAVRRLLSTWSGQQDPAQRWTVARTYALLGGATALSALRDVGRMAVTMREPDDVLQTALEQTVEALLQSPAATVVLEKLLRWHEEPGPLRELAVSAFLRAGRRAQPGAGAIGDWPRLLLLAAREEGARQPLVRMLRRLLSDNASRAEASEIMAGWVRAAQRASLRPARGRQGDPWPCETENAVASDVESALAALLPALVGSKNDRDRLDYLLRRAAGPERDRHSTVERLREALGREQRALPA